MQKICVVEGCKTKSRAGGMCQKHYDRVRRTGVPDDPVWKREDPRILFKRHINIDENGCWLWTGATHKGYGRFRLEGKNSMPSHRAAWVLFREFCKDFDSLLVCHKCDVPLCVNPDHLFLGTVQDNVDDKIKKKRLVVIKGTEQPHAKLNDDAIRLIRSGQVSRTKLVEMFGVSLGLIKGIRAGKRWKHVV